jgi:hypothetical protein
MQGKRKRLSRYVKALRACGKGDKIGLDACKKCPYNEVGDNCFQVLARDLHDYVTYIEKLCENYKDENYKLIAENSKICDENAKYIEHFTALKRDFDKELEKQVRADIATEIFDDLINYTEACIQAGYQGIGVKDLKDKAKSYGAEVKQ